MRDELYREMLAARAEGVTLSAMARALGISRQRVQKIFERLDR
jgi:DNA invertase Pin-like site-specific DNA recombinase